MKNLRKPAWWKVILKLAVCLSLGTALVSAGIIALTEIQDRDWEKDPQQQLKWCRDYYDEKDLAGLRSELALFDLYGEEFDLYWEAVRGYEDYLAWRQWAKALDMDLSQSREKAAYYEKKVYENLANAQFEENVPIFRDFVSKMESARGE